MRMPSSPTTATRRFSISDFDAHAVQWPFQRARLNWPYGGWLRRQRRVSESRTALRAARDAFDAWT